MEVVSTWSPEMGIGRALVYNAYAVTDARILPGYNEASKHVKWVVRQFVNTKKIMGSRSLAQQVIRKNLKPEVIVTDEEIDDAYAIGAGGGCEYEWPYE